MGWNRENLLQESVSAVTTTASVALGTRRFVNGAEYVYCYNGATVADKALLVKPLTAGTEYTFSVTTVAHGVGPVIGMVKNATCAAASYCWVMTKGYGKGMVSGAVTYSVGGALAPVRITQGADGTIDISTAGIGSTGVTVGFLTSAITDVTGTSVGVYINTGF